MFNARRLTAAATAGILATTFIVNARVAATAASDASGQGIYSRTLADLNVALAARRSSVRIDRADISVTTAGWQGATTIFANDRTHQVESLFVARDPRRGGFPDISYLVDQSDGVALGFNAANAVVALPNAVTEPRIDASMLRWQNSPSCPGPAITKLVDDGSDPDLVDGLVFGDPAQIGTPRADITHAGWLPAAFFNAVVPDGANFILGVTFTFVFTDDDGNPTDVDHDGRSDAAFSEIYYNRAVPWTAGASRPDSVDIDSVATHESGHAFGLGHFGKVFLDNKENLKFAPRAVMNAVYVSPFAELAGTDNASFCQIWAHRK
jgi:hypothetical protein